METIIRGQKAVAEHFGVADRTVRNWIKAGMPRLSGRRFDLVQIQKWLDQRQGIEAAPLMARSTDPRQPDLPASRGKNFQDERLKRAKADLAELELGKIRGELMERSTVEGLFVARIMAVKQGLLSLPRSLPPQLIHCREERDMESLIARAVRDLLEGFARPLPAAIGGQNSESPPEMAQGG
jgi:phage terminase Nu1 subunit (DNA packaging protein)